MRSTDDIVDDHDYLAWEQHRQQHQQLFKDAQFDKQPPLVPLLATGKSAMADDTSVQTAQVPSAPKAYSKYTRIAGWFCKRSSGGLKTWNFWAPPIFVGGREVKVPDYKYSDDVTICSADDIPAYSTDAIANAYETWRQKHRKQAEQALEIARKEKAEQAKRQAVEAANRELQAEIDHYCSIRDRQSFAWRLRVTAGGQEQMEENDGLEEMNDDDGREEAEAQAKAPKKRAKDETCGGTAESGKVKKLKIQAIADAEATVCEIRRVLETAQQQGLTRVAAMLSTAVENELQKLEGLRSPEEDKQLKDNDERGANNDNPGTTTVPVKEKSADAEVAVADNGVPGTSTITVIKDAEKETPTGEEEMLDSATPGGNKCGSKHKDAKVSALQRDILRVTERPKVWRGEKTATDESLAQEEEQAATEQGRRALARSKAKTRPKDKRTGCTIPKYDPECDGTAAIFPRAEYRRRRAGESSASLASQMAVRVF